MNKKLLFAVTVSALLAFYFSGVGFRFSFYEQLITGLAAFALLYFAAKRGWQSYWLVVFSTYFLAASLGCAFLHPEGGTGPLAINFSLSPIAIIVISAMAGISVFFWNKIWNSKAVLPQFCLRCLFWTG